ncbi:imidazolonepropionase-like amidohydrolase [Larkinella arboricola]|uniref:Imidazolonepropionase-like amidohydrolase n=1 Tax=Larkinella arboricola TaxID=643671 RepID=A0A327WRB8_LARAB|nr:amidohydrolase family protein [Larkinella arboricola]RAJ94460.1 imidazolonepropionase-like amidohydrolase [Larkinella arboricola]
MKKITLAISLLASLNGFAQNPAPAGPQTRAVALTGATLHIGNGQVITNGTIVFDKGVITAVGNGDTPINGAERIDATGKHIYPGLISPAATVGLQEFASVRATLDFRETGSLNPNVRSLIAYNTDSEVIPTIRNNGLLMTQAVPDGGVMAGSSSVMQTDGWNWEDAVLKADDGLWLQWPGYFARSFDFETFGVSLKKNEQRQDAINALKATFSDARAYADLKNPAPKNLKLEAMRGLFDGTRCLYIRANYGKDIIEAVRFAKQMGVKKPVIVGAEDAARVVDFLKENQVPVILGPMHRLPTLEDEDVYLPYKLPGILQKAGILVSLSYDGEWWRTRNLPFQAGTAVGFSGLDKEEALKMLTSNTAKIMGIDNVVGTLEKGKHATLVVSKGDLLDMRTNVIEHAFIQGRHINLDDKHKRLYHMYREKYGQPDIGK